MVVQLPVVELPGQEQASKKSKGTIAAIRQGQEAKRKANPFLQGRRLDF
jgi:hypothetical protein